MRYRFADIEFELNTVNLPVEEDEWTQRFVSDAALPADFSYTEKTLLPELLSSGKQLKYSGGYELFETPRGIFQLNHWATCREAYGFFPADLQENTDFFVNRETRDQIPMAASYFLSTMGLHSRLMTKGAVVLHASYIEWNGKAILFSGPSGMGKSTQAELWSKHAGARIINGDRALLRKKDGRWMVYGYPCCGSSLVCENRTLPLAAVVILRRGEKDELVQASVAKKIYALTTATEIYPWIEREVNDAMAIAQELCGSVAVVQYACTKEPSAVETLKAYLE